MTAIGMGDHRRSVLIISNGHGEDAVGMTLAEALGPYASLTGYPLVGLGRAYRGTPLLDPRRALPSGGFALRGSWRGLWADLRDGALRAWQEQRETLRQQRGRHDLAIAIGDTYCLWMTASSGAPVVFIATAKSQRHDPYLWVERLLLRRLARAVFARDQVTADALAEAGVPARCVGNPLMDTITSGSETLPLRGNRPIITFLPGSRAGAYANVPLLLRLCEEVSRQVEVDFLCALAAGVDREKLDAAAWQTGWTVSGQILKSGSIEIALTTAFGDAVQAAEVVVGLAGTANEQAAGLGKPVVAFPGPSSQFTPRFLALQQRLLGEALVAASGWREAATAIVRLLHDPVERARRGEVGRARMGPPGAVSKIATEIIRLLNADSDHGNPGVSKPGAAS